MLVLRTGVARVRVDELAFSPDGTMLAAPGGAGGVCLWQLPGTNPKSDVLKVPRSSIKRLVFSPDSKALYAGDDQVFRIDLARRKRSRLNIPRWGSLWFGVSLDGSRLFVAETPAGTQEMRLTCWTASSFDIPAHEVVSQSLVHMTPLFPPTGDHFIMVEENRRPDRQWEFRRVKRSAETGEVVERSESLADFPEQTVLSADGSTLACRTREVIRIYPAAGTWKDVPTIANDSKKHFTGIAFHPSGRYLAATSNDQTVKLYDTATWQPAKTFTWNIGRMRSIAFSPDGTLAAAGSDQGKVVVWDVDL